MGWDVKGIINAISEANEDAKAKCMSLAGKDVTVLVGCTGSGKTTVFLYVQGEEFELVCGEVRARDAAARAEIGDTMRSATRGLQVAQKQTGGTQLVDLAGTGDSAGPVADLCGGVYRSSVLQEAGSVRVLLVMSLDRFSVGNDRAKGAVRDLEHVAGFFRGDVRRYLGSVGLIVTSPPRFLMELSPAAGILHRLADVFEDIAKGAGLHGEAGAREGIEIAAGGLELLGYLSEQCKKACSLTSEVIEGDDLELVERLASARCAVYPVNVLQGQQRCHLVSFISNLQPVKAPRDAMLYVLPDECRSNLTSALDKESMTVRKRLESRGADWAMDEGLLEDLFKLLHLLSVLGQRRLLEWATLLEQEWLRQLVFQNKRGVERLLEGVTRGNLARVDGGLEALRAMDTFRKELAAKQPLLQLQDWSSCWVATSKAMEIVKQEARIPEDLSSVSWDASIRDRLLVALKTAAKLESQGRDFVADWAKRLTCHIAALKSRAAECTEVNCVITAIRHLELLCQSLPEILEFLSGFNGELPTSLESLLLDAKAAVREKLQEMSRRMGEAMEVSGSQAGVQEREKLQRFCGSTELNELLGGENLMDAFMFKPLSSVLVPGQAEIDSITGLLGQQDPSDTWCTDLSHLAQQIENAGNLGLKMVEVAGLQFNDLLKALTSRVEQEKAAVQETTKDLGDVSQQPRPSFAAASVISGDHGRLDIEGELMEEPADVEDAERALARLKLLLPGDTLLGLLAERPDPSRTALRALHNCAWLLSGTLESLLKKARKELRRSSGSVLDVRALSVMAKLAAGTSLAKAALEALRASSDRLVASTCEKLTGISGEATTFIGDLVQGQLRQWEEATAGAKGWQQLFLRHLQQARRLEVLAEDEVCPARARLVQKVLAWRDNRLAQAQEACKEGGSWQEFLDLAVRQGLAFEEGTLFAVTDLQEEDFRELVECQVARWTRQVETSLGSMTPAMGQKLRAVAAALEQLPGYARKDTRTLQLRGSLSKPLERLEAALSESDVRFRKALAEERYAEACQCLGRQESQLQQEQLMEELGRTVEEGLDQLGSNADEEDMVQAAKKLRNLLQALERAKPQGADMVERVKALKSSLREGLAAKKQEAAEHLQRALDGRGLPSRALAILAALSGTGKVAAAEEGLQIFISEKKEDLKNMAMQQLLDWITRQDRLHRSAGVPEELKGTSSMAYEELIKKDFMTRFSEAFKAGLGDLEKCHKEKDWGMVKQTAEMLRDVIESALELELLSNERLRLRGLKSRLGVGSGGNLAQAMEEVKRGSFWMALRKLVAGEGGSAEQELCEAISVELARNMNTANEDVTTCSQRLSVLESFLAEVGEHPPDELRSLVHEVQEVCKRMRPKVDGLAMAAVEESLAAASGRNIELQRTVKALALVKNFENSLSDEKKGQLRQAVADFWHRVKRAVDKVAEDIQNLDMQSLTLTLDPLRHWLHAFSQLSDDEKQVLMGGLHSQLADLKTWLLEVLAKPLKDMVDSHTVAREAASMSFASISLRCKVAEKLSEILQTATVNLSPLEEKMLWHKDAGMAALQRASSLEDFNPHYKALKSASVELPELVVAARYLGDLRDSFRVTVLDAHLPKLRAAQSVEEALKHILDLRKLANEAPDAYEDVTSRLRSGLSEMQARLKPREINALGGRLGQCQLGQLVLAEFPEIFGSAKEMQSNAAFRRAGETGNSDELVARLMRESGLGDIEWAELASCLRAHETKFKELKQTYLLQGKSLEVVKEECKHDLETLASKVKAEKAAVKKAEMGRDLISHLSICYSIIKCGREFMEAPAAEQQDCFVAPHRAQILTIFRLLHAHKTGSISIWSWLSSWTSSSSTASSPSSTASSPVPENHLAQVLTGEGKALTLGLLAAFLALQGICSDVVCYRKILTAQDCQAMLPFYSFLGVEDMIRYVTFDELCEERLQAIRSCSEALLLEEADAHGSPTADPCNVSRRALLIDEVDVFFGRRFYGQTWDGAFKLKTKGAKDLVRFVFEEARSGREISNVRQSTAFSTLLAETPKEMHGALGCAAESLVANIQDWSKPEPVLDDIRGQVGYKENDEINFNLCHANKTVFAYLAFEMDGKLTSEQVAPHVGIDLVCGRFSFAELPKEYCCILGVTGTLKAMLEVDGIEHLLKTEYGFKHFTFTPSVFGGQRLTFRAAEHIEVLDNESDWLSRIESVVEDQKKGGNATLVFFKNEEQLHKFPNWATFESITERTEARRRNGYIAAATATGRVTLMTKAFGRGIDFQMPDGHQVVVVQTYLSSTVSEETQIKGRTARQGKSGQYRMVLCGEHLQAKMAFSPQEVQTLKTASGDKIQRLLSQKQFLKTKSKANGLWQKKEKAAQLERDTKAWEQLLFDGNAPKSQKRQKLAAWNEDVHNPLHYTILLDNSYSMSCESRWEALTTAFDSFRQELLSDPVSAAATTVSVCLFNNSYHVVRPTHSKPAEVQGIGHFNVGGGTDFGAAFAAAHHLMSRSPPQTKESILFLTDGEAKVPKRQVLKLLGDHGKRIKNITCVAFGRDADVSVLQKIGALFVDEGVSFRLTTPQDQESLVQHFVAAAGDRAVHLGSASS